MDAILSVTDLRKTYQAVEALRGVALEVKAGEVHAICGDNGAGKSTLIKLIAGVETVDGGEIRVRGRSVAFDSPRDALAVGIATIHQDLGLAPRMTVYQNIFMGSELERRSFGLRLLDRKGMMEQSLGYLRQLSSNLGDMTVAVESLSGGQRQAVAICRALRWKADIIIMDEPTAALGVRETEQVLALIRQLKANGTTVILISHNMNDVISVADQVTILRAGRTVLSTGVGKLTAEALAQLVLVGRAADGAYS